jgi:hypothetical protein
MVLGAGALPGYTVVVPAGWGGGGQFVIKPGGAVIGLSVWQVAQIPTDPCRWKGHLVHVGPSVDDHGRLLVGQKLRNATTPTDVTLAGYSGKYLQWSVPADPAVVGDASWNACDTWPDNGAHDFVSWLGTGGGERYQQELGQIDRLWVLDVDGQTLVVDATYSANATATDQRELGDVAASLRFEHP